MAEGPKGLAGDSQMMIMSSMRKCIRQIAAAVVVVATCAGAAGQCPIPTFESLQPTTIPPTAGKVVARDFNGDGWPDVAVTNYQTNSILVALNMRSRPNVVFSSASSYSVGGNPQKLDSGDVDGDGFIDLVTANRDTNDISVLYGNGDGTFLPEVYRRVGTQPLAVLVVDLNDDERDDIIVAGTTNGGVFGTVSVVLSLDTRVLGAVDEYSVGTLPLEVRAGDVNGDGRQDLVTANFGAQPNDFSVLLNDGTGIFMPEMYTRVRDLISGIVVDDFDSDGTDEIVVGARTQHPNSGRVDVFEFGQGDNIVLGSV